MTDLPPSAARVQEEARRLGLDVEVRLTTGPARTAEEAAAACGCSVSQIVKSLVFEGEASATPYLLLVSGDNRVDERGAAAASIGEPLRRPDAAMVRALTGFSVGGIPPFAHDAHLPAYMDEALLTHETVWAAAGTPNAVFPVAPRALAEAIGAPIVRLA